jgi:hypothetical protein
MKIWLETPYSCCENETRPAKGHPDLFGSKYSS